MFSELNSLKNEEKHISIKINILSSFTFNLYLSTRIHQSTDDCNYLNYHVQNYEKLIFLNIHTYFILIY